MVEIFAHLNYRSNPQLYGIFLPAMAYFLLLYFYILPVYILLIKTYNFKACSKLLRTEGERIQAKI